MRDKVEAGAFHIQQANEKHLKAVCVARRIAAPRTHDIRYLLDLLGPDAAVERFRHDLVATNLWAVQMRYPGSAPPHPDEIAAARSAMQALRAWAIQAIET